MLRRSIHDARDYHVLGLHDYDGVGNVDDLGYYVSVEGYLKALTERVREFDRGGGPSGSRPARRPGPLG